MKHFLTILLTFVIVAAAIVITCPDKAKHLEAFDEIIDHSINQDETGMAALFSVFGGKRLIHNFFDPLLHVNNYFVVSIGEIQLAENESKTVSVGLLGHVFTIDKEQAVQILKEENIL